MILLFLLPLFFLLPVVGIVLGILTAVDVGKYPEWAFGQTGASKTVWQILPIVLGFFCLGIGGIVMYVMWTSSRRDAVARAAQAGVQPPYGYGAPPAPIPPGVAPPPSGWSPPPTAPGWSAPQQPGVPQYPPSKFPPPPPPQPQGYPPPQTGPPPGPPQ
jgi:hypothetical protein